MLDTLISNVTIVTMDERMQVLFGACLGISQGKISYIGKKPTEEKPEVIVDGTGMVEMPGLINCHTHLHTTLLRGLVDDVSNREALEVLLQKESKLDNRSAKASALLGIAECLRFGVTSVSDLTLFPQAVAEAVDETGIKANIALAAQRFADENEEFDFETDPQCQELCRMKEAWHGHDKGRIRVDAGIYAQYTSNSPLWEGLSDYAAEAGLGFQLHLSETEGEVQDCEDRTGLTPAELLSCHRVFRVPVTAADCAYLTEEERKLLGQHHASAVALPIASAKSGKISTPISQSVRAGMNVALGTGGAVESGNLDMFQVMRAAALSQRVADGAPETMPPQAVLMMATVCGARAQGRSQETGMLKEGMDADIILVDFTAPHLMPCHNVLSGLVFSASGADVAMTMVQGKILYQNGKFITIDLGAVVQELTDYAIDRAFSEENHGA